MKKNTRRMFDPAVPPVKKVELNDQHRTLKIVLIVALLAIGVTLIVTSLVGLLKTEPGWVSIQANAATTESCGGDFKFQYLVGAGEKAANLEQQELTQLYTQATKDAFEIFHESKLFDGVNNVAYLNQHPNTQVQVPKVLYDAFNLLEQYGNRSLYLAPIYREYVGLCLSDSDSEARSYDPAQNPEQAAYFEEVLAFVNDGENISLKLLGDNQVELFVSAAYLQYAQDSGIENFLDFYWLKNAFIVDYLAQEMISAGFTRGSIVSFDGFIRNLDDSGESYRLNVFDFVGDEVYPVGALEYSGAMAFASLRSYPTSTLAVQQYYLWGDGHYTSCHIDLADGLNKTAVNDWLGYSKTLGCAQMLMQMQPLYVSAEWDAQAAAELDGMESIYCVNRTVIATEEGVKLVNLYQDDSVSYTLG